MKYSVTRRKERNTTGVVRSVFQKMMEVVLVWTHSPVFLEILGLVLILMVEEKLPEVAILL